MTKPPANLRQTGCAIALTAAVALPVGFWLAGTMPPAPAERRAESRSSHSRPSLPRMPVARDVFSTNIRNDPYVLDRQTALVEAMEGDCRRTGTGCPEAQAARAYIAGRTAR